MMERSPAAIMNSKQKSQAVNRQSYLSGMRAMLCSVRAYAVTVAMLFMFAPVISSALDIGNLFHADMQSESSMPCHDEQPSSSQCCCHAQPDGHPCQCSSGQCVGSVMSLIMFSLDHSYDNSDDIHPAFVLINRDSPSPPINLRPPITNL